MTKEHANEGELQGPALYTLWPNQRSLPEFPSLPPAYRIRAVASERVDQARSIVEADGVVTDNEWQRYRNSLVPDGLFAILDRESAGSVSYRPFSNARYRAPRAYRESVLVIVCWRNP
jgi:hypothetical protein